jgi:predicted nucleic acid-binding protein
MGIIIDTAVLIDFEKGRIHLNKHISEREEDEFCISVITASELLQGFTERQIPIFAKNVPCSWRAY